MIRTTSPTSSPTGAATLVELPSDLSLGDWTSRVDRLPCCERPVPGVLTGTGVLPG